MLRSAFVPPWNTSGLVSRNVAAADRTLTEATRTRVRQSPRRANDKDCAEDGPPDDQARQGRPTAGEDDAGHGERCRQPAHGAPTRPGRPPGSDRAAPVRGGRRRTGSTRRTCPTMGPGADGPPAHQAGKAQPTSSRPAKQTAAARTSGPAGRGRPGPDQDDDAGRQDVRACGDSPCASDVTRPGARAEPTRRARRGRRGREWAGTARAGPR